jgi:hypothetical protein
MDGEFKLHKANIYKISAGDSFYYYRVVGIRGSEGRKVAVQRMKFVEGAENSLIPYKVNCKEEEGRIIIKYRKELKKGIKVAMAQEDLDKLIQIRNTQPLNPLPKNPVSPRFRHSKLRKKDSHLEHKERDSAKKPVSVKDGYEEDGSDGDSESDEVIAGAGEGAKVDEHHHTPIRDAVVSAGTSTPATSLSGSGSNVSSIPRRWVLPELPPSPPSEEEINKMFFRKIEDWKLMSYDACYSRSVETGYIVGDQEVVDEKYRDLLEKPINPLWTITKELSRQTGGKFYPQYFKMRLYDEDFYHIFGPGEGFLIAEKSLFEGKRLDLVKTAKAIEYIVACDGKRIFSRIAYDGKRIFSRTEKKSDFKEMTPQEVLNFKKNICGCEDGLFRVEHGRAMDLLTNMPKEDLNKVILSAIVKAAVVAASAIVKCINFMAEKKRSPCDEEDLYWMGEEIIKIWRGERSRSKIDFEECDIQTLKLEELLIGDDITDNDVMKRRVRQRDDMILEKRLPFAVFELNESGEKIPNPKYKKDPEALKYYLDMPKTISITISIVGNIERFYKKSESPDELKREEILMKILLFLIKNNGKVATPIDEDFVKDLKAIGVIFDGVQDGSKRHEGRSSENSILENIKVFYDFITLYFDRIKEYYNLAQLQNGKLVFFDEISVEDSKAAAGAGSGAVSANPEINIRRTISRQQLAEALEGRLELSKPKPSPSPGSYVGAASRFSAGARAGVE